MNKALIWTDGAARGNPNGPGGYGAIVKVTDENGGTSEYELSAGYDKTTNNRMELMGVITALESLKSPSVVTVTSDSQYVIKAFNDNWIAGWLKRGWVNSSKEPVKNIELWKRLLEAVKPHEITWVWVKGHEGHAENERCDTLATSAADASPETLFHDDGGDLRSPVNSCGKTGGSDKTGDRVRKMEIRDEVLRLKQSAPELSAASIEMRNRALIIMAQRIEDRRDEIFEANARDMERAEKNDIPDVVKKRLLYNEGKLSDSISGLKQLALLPDPLGKINFTRQLDEGLILRRVSVPIGVIGVIFEARPDAMVQIASLCIKSGNCAILKGGRETADTNAVLFGIIKDSITEAGLPGDALAQATLHSEIDDLLKCDDCVDLIIPRGTNEFVRHIMDNTKIPVMGHSSGICHIFADIDADRELSLSVIRDAKVQYPAVCNAVETILVHRGIAESFIPAMYEVLTKEGVKFRGTEEACRIIREKAGGESELMRDDEFSTEYDDLVISVKVVEDVKEAVRHINHFGSHHTDAILTENDETYGYFAQMVDSAGVYRNCSTRFADGFRYGFGAEVGVSTGKLHARGPVGLEGLTTYKYLLEGKGHIVGDYASGKKEFHHKDL